MSDKKADNKKERIGVYVCHCGINIAGKVDCEKVAESVKDLPGVTVSKSYKYMCSEPGQKLIQEDIEKEGLDRVVVASCSPLMHEPTFQGAVKEAGVNEYMFQMANIREQCSWVTKDPEKATEKATSLVGGAIARIRLHEPLEPQKVPVEKSALVIGAGIAGITAALNIANSGFPVHLVERSPRMVDVARHPNITIHSMTEVTACDGYVGNFKVTLNQRSRYIDLEKCTSCGDCEAECPVELYNEFDEGLTLRTATSRLFPQAIPNKYYIDKHGSSPCRQGCPLGMNTHAMANLIAAGKLPEALGVIRQDIVFPRILGRVCHHPCEDACYRGDIDEPISIMSLKRFVADLEADGKIEMPIPPLGPNEILPPTPLDPKVLGKRVAIVGSGPGGMAVAHYLAEQGVKPVIFDNMPKPGGMMRYGILAYRLPRDVIDYAFSRLTEMGVELQQGVSIGADNPDGLTVAKLKKEYDAVVIATGAHKPKNLRLPGTEKPHKNIMLGTTFLRQFNLGKKLKLGKKIVVIGGGNVAADVAHTAKRLAHNQHSEGVEVHLACLESFEEMPAFPWERKAILEEGVTLHTRKGPTRVMLEDGVVTGVEVRPCRRVYDEEGRFNPEYDECVGEIISGDTVILAIGQDTDISYL
ncbi:MAG: FAD-dependent oxidoreductase, partial [Candidatus Ranarchaeia archaeon]